MPYFFIMRKVIFTILSVLLSVVATCQDIDFVVEKVASGDYNPKIYRVNKLYEELKIYRKYSNDTVFQLIATKTFSSLIDPFVDDSISICHDHDLDASGCNVFYYITNYDSTSFSEVKGGNFGDSNFPEWPNLTHLDIENDTTLVLYWEPSDSDDIHYYKLCRRNSSGDWDSINCYYKHTTPITIAKNICGDTNIIFPYTIFATDFCGNPSRVGELESTNILYPPILESVEYDNCNTLTFKRNKNRSLNGEITGCKIQYKLDYTAQEIKDSIESPLQYVDPIETDFQIYRLNVLEYPELSNTNHIFRIRTTARTADGQYLSSNTCWSDPVSIGEIPEAPDFSIVSVITNSNNSNNSITLRITDNSSNPISGRKYILTRDYGGSTQEIWSKNDDEIPSRFTTTFTDDISNTNSYINYRLSVVYKCNNDTLGETCFNSIYLDTSGNDTEIALSWNSISTDQYDDITYNVVRTYNGEEYSEDVQNNTTYTEDLSFIDPNSFKPVKWHVEAINNGNNIIAVSNTITLENSGDLLMPDAFIPDSEHEINRFFGPMNKFDENNIKKYTLRIFNNTGTLIWSTDKYSSDDLEISRWDGNDFRGQPCVRGTYIYDVYVELDENITRTARGTVTLIRNN